MTRMVAIELRSQFCRPMSTNCDLASSRSSLKAYGVRISVKIPRLAARRVVLFPQVREMANLRVGTDGEFGRGWTMGRRASLRVLWGKLDAPKPTFVALEQITGEEHFDQILTEAQQRNQPVVIDWLAAWCRKCIYLKPKLEKLAAEYYPDIKFYYVDVNTVPQSLVKRAEVTKMPTIQLWQGGERRAEVIGGHQVWLVLDEVREMINRKE